MKQREMKKKKKKKEEEESGNKTTLRKFIYNTKSIFVPDMAFKHYPFDKSKATRTNHKGESHDYFILNTC